MDNNSSSIKYLNSIVIIIISFIICYFFMNGNRSIKKLNWDIYEITKNDLNPEKFLFSEINMNSIGGGWNQNKNKDIHNIIIGIDFGSAFSGYS